MIKLANIQIGKQGVTENFVSTLKNHFAKHDIVKVSVLKSASRDKKEIKKISDELLEKLGKNYTSRVIGFTIVLRKWRKAVR